MIFSPLQAFLLCSFQNICDIVQSLVSRYNDHGIPYAKIVLSTGNLQLSIPADVTYKKVVL